MSPLMVIAMVLGMPGAMSLPPAEHPHDHHAGPEAVPA
jgi:hypothetical protein